MSNIYQNIQLDRIATAIENGDAGGGTLTINLTGVGDMQPATASTAGAHGLVPAPQAGDEGKVLSGAGTWIEAGSGGELGDLEDVTITSPTSGESLKYDGAKWVNGNVTAELPDFIEETSGNMVTVEAAERPAKSLKVAITLMQSGSGDPSPENIRPISGWTGCNIWRTGKNLIDADTYYGTYKQSDGSFVSIGSDFTMINIPIPAQLVGKEVTFSAKLKVPSDSTINNLRVRAIVNGAIVMGAYVNTADYKLSSVTVIPLSANDKFSITYGSNGSKNMQFKDVQLELGATATTYEPYTGQTYPISFTSEAGTVYGGTLDVVNGTLTVAKANIATYDGETLPGAWISDRDVYAEGTTPTTGAQVVYDLDTPTTYQLTPTEVQMLLGTNNIWADTGEVKELKYIPQTYNDLLEEVTGGGYDITTNGTPVETDITWDGYPVKCFCVRYYNLSLNTNAQDISLVEYGFSDTINGLFKVDCIVQNGDNMLNVTPHVHYDGHGNLRGRYDTSENFSYGTGYIFIYYY